MPHVEITHNQHTGDSIVNGNVQQKNFGIFPFDYTADLWPHLQNDLLCVERDVTLYSLTRSLWPPKNNKKALLSQRWPRDAPIYAIHPNFVHAYGHCTLRGFWFWTNLTGP